LCANPLTDMVAGEAVEAGSGIEPLYEDLQSRQCLFPNSPETPFTLSLQALKLRLGMPPSSATFREHPGAITHDLHFAGARVSVAVRVTPEAFQSNARRAPARTADILWVSMTGKLWELADMVRVLDEWEIARA
jgi:hypothetical protein